MRAVVAARVGEQGFARFVHDLAEIGVLTRADRLRWLDLHGQVLRLDDPLDDSRGLDEEALTRLAAELGRGVRLDGLDLDDELCGDHFEDVPP